MYRILETKIFLPQPPECWGYRRALPYPTYLSAFMNKAAMNVQIICLSPCFLF